MPIYFRASRINKVYIKAIILAGLI
ncbi:hypothetical protein FG05_35081 [Fusarium graminearum]|nr:hypothetical protein FG05_35081 [Fusarium graminearum]